MSTNMKSGDEYEATYPEDNDYLEEMSTLDAFSREFQTDHPTIDDTIEKISTLPDVSFIDRLTSFADDSPTFAQVDVTDTKFDTPFEQEIEDETRSETFQYPTSPARNTDVLITNIPPAKDTSNEISVSDAFSREYTTQYPHTDHIPDKLSTVQQYTVEYETVDDISGELFTPDELPYEYQTDFPAIDDTHFDEISTIKITSEMTTIDEISIDYPTSVDFIEEISTVPDISVIDSVTQLSDELLTIAEGNVNDSTFEQEVENEVQEITFDKHSTAPSEDTDVRITTHPLSEDVTIEIETNNAIDRKHSTENLYTDNTSEDLTTLEQYIDEYATVDDISAELFTPDEFPYEYQTDFPEINDTYFDELSTVGNNLDITTTDRETPLFSQLSTVITKAKEEEISGVFATVVEPKEDEIFTNEKVLTQYTTDLPVKSIITENPTPHEKYPEQYTDEYATDDIFTDDTPTTDKFAYEFSTDFPTINDAHVDTLSTAKHIPDTTKPADTRPLSEQLLTVVDGSVNNFVTSPEDSVGNDIRKPITNKEQDVPERYISSAFATDVQPEAEVTVKMSTNMKSGDEYEATYPEDNDYLEEMSTLDAFSREFQTGHSPIDDTIEEMSTVPDVSFIDRLTLFADDSPTFAQVDVTDTKFDTSFKQKIEDETRRETFQYPTSPAENTNVLITNSPPAEDTFDEISVSNAISIEYTTRYRHADDIPGKLSTLQQYTDKYEIVDDFVGELFTPDEFPYEFQTDFPTIDDTYFDEKLTAENTPEISTIDNETPLFGDLSSITENARNDVTPTEKVIDEEMQMNTTNDNAREPEKKAAAAGELSSVLTTDLQSEEEVFDEMFTNEGLKTQYTTPKDSVITGNPNLHDEWPEQYTDEYATLNNTLRTFDNIAEEHLSTEKPYTFQTNFVTNDKVIYDLTTNDNVTPLFHEISTIAKHHPSNAEFDTSFQMETEDETHKSTFNEYTIEPDQNNDAFITNPSEVDESVEIAINALHKKYTTEYPHTDSILKEESTSTQYIDEYATVDNFSEKVFTPKVEEEEEEFPHEFKTDFPTIDDTFFDEFSTEEHFPDVSAIDNVTPLFEEISTLTQGHVSEISFDTSFEVGKENDVQGETFNKYSTESVESTGERITNLAPEVGVEDEISTSNAIHIPSTITYTQTDSISDKLSTSEHYTDEYATADKFPEEFFTPDEFPYEFQTDFPTIDDALFDEISTSKNDYDNLPTAGKVTSVAFTREAEIIEDDIITMPEVSTGDGITIDGETMSTYTNKDQNAPDKVIPHATTSDLSPKIYISQKMATKQFPTQHSTRYPNEADITEQLTTLDKHRDHYTAGDFSDIATVDVMTPSFDEITTELDKLETVENLLDITTVNKVTPLFEETSSIVQRNVSEFLGEQITPYADGVSDKLSTLEQYTDEYATVDDFAEEFFTPDDFSYEFQTDFPTIDDRDFEKLSTVDNIPGVATVEEMSTIAESDVSGTNFGTSFEIDTEDEIQEKDISNKYPTEPFEITDVIVTNHPELADASVEISTTAILRHQTTPHPNTGRTTKVSTLKSYTDEFETIENFSEELITPDDFPFGYETDFPTVGETFVDKISTDKTIPDVTPTDKITRVLNEMSTIGEDGLEIVEHNLNTLPDVVANNEIKIPEKILDHVFTRSPLFDEHSTLDEVHISQSNFDTSFQHEIENTFNEYATEPDINTNVLTTNILPDVDVLDKLPASKKILSQQTTSNTDSILELSTSEHYIDEYATVDSISEEFFTTDEFPSGFQTDFPAIDDAYFDGTTTTRSGHDLTANDIVTPVFDDNATLAEIAETVEDNFNTMSDTIVTEDTQTIENVHESKKEVAEVPTSDFLSETDMHQKMSTNMKSTTHHPKEDVTTDDFPYEFITNFTTVDDTLVDELLTVKTTEDGAAP